MRTNALTWKSPLFLISIALITLLLFYSNSLLALFSYWWNSSDYSHGVLLPIISLYLIWLKRQPLANTASSPQPAALLLLFILSASWLVAKTIDVLFIERMTIIALFPTLIWALLGNKKTKIILFPLTYLFFAAPVWDFFAVPLQNLTALASFKLLQLTNLPILLEEHYISIPAGKFLIAKACSGLRFFIAAAAISALYAHLNYRSLSRQLIFIAIALVGAIILNWIRVCIIIWIGHLTNMEHPIVEDHNSLGWWLFTAALLPLFYFGAKFQEQADTSPSPNNQASTKKRNSTLLSFTLISMLILSIAPITLYFADKNSLANSSHQIAPPSAIKPWEMLPSSNNDWAPVFNGASTQYTQSYHSNTGTIHLHTSYFAKQTQGTELINELNTFYDKKSWKLINQTTQQIQLPNNETLKIQELQLQNSHKRTRIIWYWYQVADKSTIDPILAKLLELRKLIGKPPGSVVIALAIDNIKPIDQTRQSLKTFLQGTYPAITASFQDNYDVSVNIN
jgi:exosortase A